MIALLITLKDFPDYVPFSVNIAEALVNPHIRTAQTMEVWPLLPLALRAELVAAVGEAAPGGEDGEDGEFCGSEFYTPSGGVLAGLPAFFREHVRPLLVVESAREMMLWHGLHITPAGAQTISDPATGAQPISGQQRAELRANLATKCGQYRGRLETALRLAYPASYSTACPGARRRPTSGGLQISAV